MINVSVVPTFYPINTLTRQKEVLDDPLPLDILEERLREISRHHEIRSLDVMGGEISYLSNEYLTVLLKSISKYYVGTPNLYSELDHMPSMFKQENPPFSLTVVMNEDEKVHHTMTHLIEIPFEVEMMVLIRHSHTTATESQVVETIDSINKVKNVWSVFFRPWSTNNYRKGSLTFEQFEEFLKRWLRSDTFAKTLMNRKMIEQSIQGGRNAFATNHIYVLPTGKFGVMSYDEPEKIISFETFEEYMDWCEEEKRAIMTNSFCSTCEYVGHCMTDHYQRVRGMDHSCNGYKNLLDWYRQNFRV